MDFLFTVFYQPTANVLFFLMDLLSTSSLTVGILALVVVSKILLLPSSIKNTHMQVKMGGIADELKEIKESTTDRKEQAEKTLQVYRREGINPLSPIIALFIQIPIFISIFFVVRDLGNGTFPFSNVFYSFVDAPSALNYAFISSHLTEQGGLFIAVMVFCTQVLLTHFTSRSMSEGGKSTQKIIFFIIMPVLVAVFSYFIVATVGVYWLFNNMVTIFQEFFVVNRIRRQMEEPDDQPALENPEHPQA